MYYFYQLGTFHQNNTSKDMPIAINTWRNNRIRLNFEGQDYKKKVFYQLVTEYTGSSVYMLYMVTEERRITIVTEYKFVNVSR